jgi:hypothetical protein
MTDFEDDDPAALPFDRIVDRLVDAGGTGRDVMAYCPAHNDRTPSLHVTEVEDLSVLINCFAGCTFEAVLEAIDLEPKDLFPSEFAIAIHGWRGTAHRRQPDRLRRDVPRESLGGENAGFRDYLEANPAGSDDVAWLAKHLGVTRRSVRALNVGFDIDRDAFLFPERNGRREIVGMVRRYRDDCKRSVKGGRRGLTIPQGFDPAAGPIYVAEGSSDTAALLAVGLNAVGRPQIQAGDAVVGALLELLPVEGHAVYVVADAGDAAAAAAEKLAVQLLEVIESPVGLAKPADGFKDVRAQVGAGRWDLGLITEVMIDG